MVSVLKTDKVFDKNGNYRRLPLIKSGFSFPIIEC